MKNFKKFLNIFLLIVLACTSLGSVQAQTTSDTATSDNQMFSDVYSTDKNFDAIYSLYNAGIINGYENKDKNTKEYKPEKEINRAEFLKLLMESSGKATHKNYASCFPDVKFDEWYGTYVCQAKEEGFVNGYPDGKFKPEGTINEAEALKMIGEVTGWNIQKTANEDWYKPYLNFAQNKKIITDDNISKLMTRGDIAGILFKNREVEISIENNNSTVSDNTTDTNTIETSTDNSSTPDTSDKDTTHKSEIELSLNKTSIAANGTDTLEITATVSDQNGKPVSDKILSANIGGGIDYHESLEMMETSVGKYTATFNTKLAQDYAVHVEDQNGNSSIWETFTATPGLLNHVEVIDISYPYQNQPYQAFIKVASKDKYENTLPYSSVNNVLDAITTFGTATTTHDENGIFTVKITASDWGIAEVSIRDKKSSAILLNIPTKIYFLPLEINMPKGISKTTDKAIEVPMYIYFPANNGILGSYSFTLHYDPAKLSFSKIDAINTSEGFTSPMYEVDRTKGIIYISQTNSKPNSYSFEDIAIGKIFFDVIGVGEGTIQPTDIVLKDTQGEEKSYYAKFAGLIGESVDSATAAIKAAKDLAVETGTAVVDTTTSAIDSALDDIAKWAYNIKDTKEICVDAFTFPNSNTTLQQINQDIGWANLIFSKIAASCNCKFYINVTLNSTTNLTAADWAVSDTNGDNDLDVAEIDALTNNHPATGQTTSGNKCAPIYYVPQIDGGDLGWSWSNRPTSGIAIDQSKDPDNKTVAHELAHQFSQGKIRDPNNPPDSATQGADTAGNLMNYNNTGDVLTKEQCSLIIFSFLQQK